MVSLISEFGSIIFWPTLDYSKAFRRIIFVSNSIHTHNSSLEGATELKFGPFYSSLDAFFC